MPTITKTLPQTEEQITITTLKEVVNNLPKLLKYPLNVWIGGELARYGQTSKNLIYLIEGEGETSSELKLYFSGISVRSATASYAFRNERLSAVKLYNEGRLIIDPKTMVYTEPPTPTKAPPIITLEEIKSKLPKEIKWEQPIYLTGSLVKNGWSGNDVDFMTETNHAEIRDFFTETLGVKVDVGNADMPEREPIYKFLIYDKGICQQ